MCMFLTEVTQTHDVGTHEGVPTSLGDFSAHRPAQCNSTDIHQRTDRSTTGTQFSLQMRSGLHRAHVTGIKESTSSSMTGLAMGQ